MCVQVYVYIDTHAVKRLGSMTLSAWDGQWVRLYCIHIKSEFNLLSALICCIHSLESPVSFHKPFLNMFLGFWKLNLVNRFAITGCFKRPWGIISDCPSPRRPHRLTELQATKGHFISGQPRVCSPLTPNDLTSRDLLLFVIGQLSRWHGRFPIHHCSGGQKEAVGWNNNP